MRRRTHALYGFVRVPDEWVDNPSSQGAKDPMAALREFRCELIAATEGRRPDHPVLRAFADVMCEVGMSLQQPLLFLDAMEQDLSVSRYRSYEDLRRYMRGSAVAVGQMMCDMLLAGNDPAMRRSAAALGEAMQLTNFLRDVGEDGRRGRIYLPQEDMAEFGVFEDEVLAGSVTDRFVRLMEFEIQRAKSLYEEADQGIPMLPPEARKAVRLARILYARILDRIEDRGYDVFKGRARTSKVEKITVAAQILVGR